MDVEVGRAAAPETPASAASEFVLEHVTAFMTLGGIESISASRYASGFGSRLHVSIAPFADAPEEITAQGVVIKDAIAQIMSVANVTGVTMKPDEEELASMKKMWEKTVREAKDANEGSARPSPGGSSGATEVQEGLI